jgi:crooked neck
MLFADYDYIFADDEKENNPMSFKFLQNAHAWAKTGGKAFVAAVVDESSSSDEEEVEHGAGRMAIDDDGDDDDDKSSVASSH